MASTSAQLTLRKYVFIVLCVFCFCAGCGWIHVEKIDEDGNGISDSDADGDSDSDADGDSDSDADGDSDSDADGDVNPTADSDFNTDAPSNSSDEMPVGPDFTRGYWLITGSEGMGESMIGTTILFTSTTLNPDGTMSLQYRMDIFMLQYPIGIETGTATYYPDTNILSVTVTFDGTAGDEYQSAYDEESDMLIADSSSQGSRGMFTAERQLDGYKLSISQVETTTERSASYAAAMMSDGSVLTYWSSQRGALAEQRIHLELSSPTSISAVRLIATQTDQTSATPIDIIVRCYDTNEKPISTVPLSFVESPVWQGKTLSVDQPVATLEMDIKGVSNARGDWLKINEIELFGDL